MPERELVDHDAVLVCDGCYQTHRHWHDDEHDELVVGYTARDPRAQYAESRPAGRCVDCGYHIYFNHSAHGILSGTSYKDNGQRVTEQGSRIFT